MPSLRATRTTLSTCLLAVALTIRFTADSHANLIGATVESDPARFAEIIVKQGNVDREFIYCLQDIRLFNDPESENCKYTVSKIDIISKKFGYGRLGENNLAILKEILAYVSASMERN
ncbi:hypothetical protein [Mesorhizobium comanense]|uniref:hypothetical protein n=1 Tax=Mesorhizobium comanense TaxID=2502215 RepID=UPI0010FA38C9|nr:hypothetical protein [Mesorhizobium comanense]